MIFMLLGRFVDFFWFFAGFIGFSSGAIIGARGNREEIEGSWE